MAAAEWWTSPEEASRRLELLSVYWNTLRNLALGRSTHPDVTDDLADDVAAEHMAYHAWRDAIPQGLIIGPVTWADELNEWTRRANAIRERIKEQLWDVEVPAPITDWTELIAPATTQAVVHSIAQTFVGMGGLALGLGALYLWGTMRRRS
jgi:hypothetical protein